MNSLHVETPSVYYKNNWREKDGKTGKERPRLDCIKWVMNYAGTDACFEMKRMTNDKFRWCTAKQSMD